VAARCGVSCRNVSGGSYVACLRGELVNVHAERKADPLNSDSNLRESQLMKFGLPKIEFPHRSHREAANSYPTTTVPPTNKLERSVAHSRLGPHTAGSVASRGSSFGELSRGTTRPRRRVGTHHAAGCLSLIRLTIVLCISQSPPTVTVTAALEQSIQVGLHLVATYARRSGRLSKAGLSGILGIARRTLPGSFELQRAT
jgi:hypothetical protein